ncbi:thyrotroph embryonic factor [Diprion similis]|uniref:thyrotroph embryonic factor n=1 Tax=Diprion similis TaxID=362088 RepID=UPI001EF88E14|nr:thyrotroph embryonic factor [Diprion similis]
MDRMFPLNVGSLEPLNFTASQSNEEREMKPQSDAEVPVLDLSCKRYSSENPLSYLVRSTVHPSEEDNRSLEHYADAERKSPLEGRSCMVTPPSEGDSPRKTRYEPIYNQINSTTSDLSMPFHPVVGLSIPPSLASSQSGVQTNLHNPMVQGHLISKSQSTSPVQMQTLDHQMIGLAVTPSQSSPEMGKKIPRPFKAYPKDPLSLSMGTTELICDQTSNEAYSEFRKRMLESVKKTNEGTNIKMRRTTAKSPSLPTSTMDEKDAAYWERRRKNNEAAKRSRDARRAKEDEIAIRAAFLEQENIKLKYELVALRNETAKLRCMVYSN